MVNTKGKKSQSEDVLSFFSQVKHNGDVKGEVINPPQHVPKAILLPLGPNRTKIRKTPIH
jgi:hypothetical protein